MKQNCYPGFLLLLYSLIESKYIHLPEIRNFSITLHGRESIPMHWLRELSICETIDEAQDSLRRKINETHMVFDDYYVSLFLGFLYLGAQEGKISAAEFEAELVDTIDAYSDYLGITVEDVHTEYLSIDKLPDESSLLGRCLIDSAEKSKRALDDLMKPNH